MQYLQDIFYVQKLDLKGQDIALSLSFFLSLFSLSLSLWDINHNSTNISEATSGFSLLKPNQIPFTFPLYKPPPWRKLNIALLWLKFTLVI